MDALLERELTYAEERQPGAIEGTSLDNLSKLGSLVVKFRAQEGNGAGYDKAKVFLENIQWIVAWLKDNDPEGLKTLAADFDAMTVQFKTELMKVDGLTLQKASSINRYRNSNSGYERAFLRSKTTRPQNRRRASNGVARICFISLPPICRIISSSRSATSTTSGRKEPSWKINLCYTARRVSMRSQHSSPSAIRSTKYAIS
jgi:hypothetical protein